MKFSVTSLLLSALAVGFAQAACQSRTQGCSPDEVCQALLSSGQVCGSTETSSGCSTSGGEITCQCCA